MDWNVFWDAVGALGGVAGLLSLAQAYRANQLAYEANRLTAQANRETRRTNERMMAMQSVDEYVYWRLRLVEREPGQYGRDGFMLRNVGSGTAHRVRMLVTDDDTERRYLNETHVIIEGGDCPAGGSLRIDYNWLDMLLDEMRRKHGGKAMWRPTIRIEWEDSNGTDHAQWVDEEFD